MSDKEDVLANLLIFPTAVRAARAGVKSMTPERVTEALETLAALLPEAIVGIDGQGLIDLWLSLIHIFKP